MSSNRRFGIAKEASILMRMFFMGQAEFFFITLGFISQFLHFLAFWVFSFFILGYFLFSRFILPLFPLFI